MFLEMPVVLHFLNVVFQCVEHHMWNSVQPHFIGGVAVVSEADILKTSAYKTKMISMAK